MWLSVATAATVGEKNGGYMVVASLMFEGRNVRLNRQVHRHITSTTKPRIVIPNNIATQPRFLSIRKMTTYYGPRILRYSRTIFLHCMAEPLIDNAYLGDRIAWYIPLSSGRQRILSFAAPTV